MSKPKHSDAPDHGKPIPDAPEELRLWEAVLAYRRSLVESIRDWESEHNPVARELATSAASAHDGQRQRLAKLDSAIRVGTREVGSDGHGKILDDLREMAAELAARNPNERHGYGEFEVREMHEAAAAEAKRLRKRLTALDSEAEASVRDEKGGGLSILQLRELAAGDKPSQEEVKAAVVAWLGNRSAHWLRDRAQTLLSRIQHVPYSRHVNLEQLYEDDNRDRREARRRGWKVSNGTHVKQAARIVSRVAEWTEPDPDDFKNLRLGRLVRER